MSKHENSLYKWVTGLALPVVIALSTILITWSMERTKVSSEYVHLAISILSAEPPENTESFEQQYALKQWAVRVLDKNSPVRMTEEEKASMLMHTPIRFHFSRADTEQLVRQLDSLRQLPESQAEEEAPNR